ncbi:MAG: 5-formyltetrahydrofolate cyclo-ligase [Clostridia bacterium]
MKDNLRSLFLTKRKQIDASSKILLDDKIYNNFINSEFYKNTDRILLYSSTKCEVCTEKIFKKAIADHKTVAFPLCDTENLTMDFYSIKSEKELFLSHYNILAPKLNPENLIIPNQNDVIIVPAILYNLQGFRIGYGKGYYDRYLTSHKIKSVGIIYEDYILDSTFNTLFDKNVNTIISEEREITIDKL